MDTSHSAHLIVFLLTYVSQLSCRPFYEQGSNHRKGDEQHGTLHDSICLHQRSMGIAREKPTRPECSGEGTGAEAGRSGRRLLLLLWGVRWSRHYGSTR